MKTFMSLKLSSHSHNSCCLQLCKPFRPFKAACDSIRSHIESVILLLTEVINCRAENLDGPRIEPCLIYDASQLKPLRPIQLGVFSQIQRSLSL